MVTEYYSFYDDTMCGVIAIKARTEADDGHTVLMGDTWKLVSYRDEWRCFHQSLDVLMMYDEIEFNEITEEDFQKVALTFISYSEGKLSATQFPNIIKGIKQL